MSDSTPSPFHEIPLNLDPALDESMMQEFLSDARDHLDQIEQGILQLEVDATNQEVVRNIFRSFHTFKGNAGFLDLTPISELAHILESLLDLARESKLVVDSSITEIILRGRDTLKQFVDEIEAQTTGQKPRQEILIPTAALKVTVRQVIDLTNGTPPVPVPVIAPPKKNKERSGKKVVAKIEPIREIAAITPAPELAPLPALESISLPVSVPEVSAIKAKASASNSGSEESGNQAIKVATNKLDGLVDLAGELVIAQSLIAQDLTSLSGQHQTLLRNMAQLARISKELQRTAMSMRMLPIRATFQKMHRLMRDVAAKQGKEVQLVLEGEETEIDRTIVEKISDPLMHMIRNAVDHAIEMPAQRLAAGKPVMGTILLRAYHKSGNIVIEVKDDGAGLNRDRILEKALHQGLIKPNVDLDDKEIYSLIFHPGFSTAQVVTDISGRGVGMDVVQKNIHNMRGKIEIDSRRGEGTQFTILLPLTLAIIDGLIIRVGDQRYILPAISVRESVHPASVKIVHLPGGGEVVHLRKELLPLLRLRDYFRLAPMEMVADAEENLGILIVVESGAQKRCLMADALVGKQEIVLKNLGQVFMTDPVVSGGAILGDGCVGLILDAGVLVRLEVKPEPLHLAA